MNSRRHTQVTAGGRHYDDDVDDDSSAASSVDLFSPFAPFRQTQATRKSETLPSDTNTSWIGAQQSPIPKNDANIPQQTSTINTAARFHPPPRNTTAATTTPFRRKQPSQQEAPSSLSSSTTKEGYATERSFLLPFARKNTNTNTNNTTDDNNNSDPNTKITNHASSNIHPLWDQTQQHQFSYNSATPSKYIYSVPIARTSHQSNSSIYTIVWLAAFHFAAMATHDGYLSYLAYRLDVTDSLQDPIPSWTWWPWVTPSVSILRRFGAFLPGRVLQQSTHQYYYFYDQDEALSESQSQQQQSHNQWWRMVTSISLVGSLVEWALLAFSWFLIQRATFSWSNQKWWWWVPIYLLSVLTGQIWMMAFHIQGMGACASWGTCGVLTAVGNTRPEKRLELFVAAILFISLNLSQTTNSTMGTIGATFFGWAYAGLGWGSTLLGLTSIGGSSDPGAERAKSEGKNPKTKKCSATLQILSFLAILKLWIVPVLIIAFREPPTTAITAMVTTSTQQQLLRRR